jgi:hypothetical protein
MKILAMTRFLPGATMDAVNALLREEATAGWALYKSGVVREWYFRTDAPGAVLMLECADIEEAKRTFSSAPLVKAGLIDFDFFPLGPYLPLEALFGGLPAGG